LDRDRARSSHQNVPVFSIVVKEQSTETSCEFALRLLVLIAIVLSSPVTNLPFGPVPYCTVENETAMVWIDLLVAGIADDEDGAENGVSNLESSFMDPLIGTLR